VSNNPKGQTLGNYICKIGYLDIRQKVDLPRKTKTPDGQIKMSGGKCEMFIYHAKNKIEGPFKSKNDAVSRAEQLMVEGFRFTKNKK